MRELDLIKQRLKLNIREYTKIIEKDNRSVTRLKRLGIEIRKLFKHIRYYIYRFHSGKELEGYTDRLTEQEIKKADERLWEFAKPVEDKYK